MKNKIPIFDCLTHPTIDGNWIDDEFEGVNTVANLLKEMETNNINWAFTVGMNNIGGYHINQYSKFIRSKSQKLYPIAFCDFELVSSLGIKHFFRILKENQYYGIKIHPRFSNITLDHPLLECMVKTAADEKMVVMLCTYYYTNCNNSHLNNVDGIIRLLNKVKDEPVILLHAGMVHLLELMEIAAVFQSVLLDLSFTICRYEGSSIDLDISYLFKNFDRRICIGSDSPQFHLKKLRERFEFFANGLSEEKARNIAYRNIFNYIGELK